MPNVISEWDGQEAVSAYKYLKDNLKPNEDHFKKQKDFEEAIHKYLNDFKVLYQHVILNGSWKRIPVIPSLDFMMIYLGYYEGSAILYKWELKKAKKYQKRLQFIRSKAIQERLQFKVYQFSMMMPKHHKILTHYIDRNFHEDKQIINNNIDMRFELSKEEENKLLKSHIIDSFEIPPAENAKKEKRNQEFIEMFKNAKKSQN